MILIGLSAKETPKFSSYTKQIQALANKSIWADQVKISKLQGLALSYVFLKIGENEFANKTVANNTMPEPHDSGVTNISILHSLKLTTIPYFAN